MCIIFSEELRGGRGSLRVCVIIVCGFVGGGRKNTECRSDFPCTLWRVLIIVIVFDNYLEGLGHIIRVDARIYGCVVYTTVGYNEP